MNLKPTPWVDLTPLATRRLERSYTKTGHLPGAGRGVYFKIQVTAPAGTSPPPEDCFSPAFLQWLKTSA